MSGGTWTIQNKRRPGAYINTKGATQAKPDTTIGRTLLINANPLNWGKNGVIELDYNSDFQSLLGAGINSDYFAALRETLKGALTVLLVNSNTGEKAMLADDKLPWSFTAKYAGTKGNDITVDVEKDPNDETKVTVTTLYQTKMVNQQVVRTTSAATLKSNNYVDVVLVPDATPDPAPEKGKIRATASTVGEDKLVALPVSSSYQLTGGTTTDDGDITEMVTTAMDSEQYNVVTTAGFALDSNIHALVAETTKKLREESGYKIRAVLPNNEGIYFDYEGVSVVGNGVELLDGTLLDTTTATGWFAGISSATGVGKSLTYATYPDAVAANPKLTNEKTISALDDGQIVFTTRRDDTVVVEQDINSLTTITDDKPIAFTKNRVIRTLDDIATDTADVFESQFIGKIDNNSTGRDLFKANRVSYLSTLNAAGIIQGFDAEDLTVEPGIDADSIVVTLGITPVDSMEKLYMTITVR